MALGISYHVRQLDVRDHVQAFTAADVPAGVSDRKSVQAWRKAIRQRNQGEPVLVRRRFHSVFLIREKRLVKRDREGHFTSDQVDAGRSVAASECETTERAAAIIVYFTDWRWLVLRRIAGGFSRQGTPGAAKCSRQRSRGRRLLTMYYS